MLARSSPTSFSWTSACRGLDGIAATRRLFDELKDGPRVLVLTTFGLEEYVYEALRAGASGFLLKDVPPEQLLAGVHVVARGDALLDPAITRSVIEEFAAGRPYAASSPTSWTSSRRASGRSSHWSPRDFRMRRSPGSSS